MDIAKQQISRFLRGTVDILVRTLPTTLIILWISSMTVGWGLSEFCEMLADSQPISPLLELITGA
ncbi:MAG: hypothetical protein OXE50_04230 [Chloroflexi bacterium]|nr:hypothetical protein [Chloroflexota bacterium]